MKVILQCTSAIVRCAEEITTFEGNIGGSPVLFTIPCHEPSQHGKFRQGNSYTGEFTEIVSPANQAQDEAIAKAAAEAKAKAEADAKLQIQAEAAIREQQEKDAHDRAVAHEVERLKIVAEAQTRAAAAAAK